jgi:hypothetical protein
MPRDKKQGKRYRQRAEGEGFRIKNHEKAGHLSPLGSHTSAQMRLLEEALGATIWQNPPHLTILMIPDGFKVKSYVSADNYPRATYGTGAPMVSLLFLKTGCFCYLFNLVPGGVSYHHLCTCGHELRVDGKVFMSLYGGLSLESSEGVYGEAQSA